VGDSNMMQYAPRISHLILKNPEKRTALFLCGGGTPPIPGVRSVHFEETKHLIEDLNLVLAENKKIDRVVFASNWAYCLNPDFHYTIDGKSLLYKKTQTEAANLLEKLLKGLSVHGYAVTMVLNIPVGKNMDPKADSFRCNFLGNVASVRSDLKKSDFLKNYGEFLSQLAVVAKSAGSQIIDPLEDLSTNDICVFKNGDVYIYRDSTHLRASYVREHVKYLDGTVAP